MLKLLDQVSALAVRIGPQMQLDIILKSDGHETGLHSRLSDYEKGDMHSQEVWNLFSAQQKSKQTVPTAQPLDEPQLPQAQDPLMDCG